MSRAAPQIVHRSNWDDPMTQAPVEAFADCPSVCAGELAARLCAGIRTLSVELALGNRALFLNDANSCVASATACCAAEIALSRCACGKAGLACTIPSSIRAELSNDITWLNMEISQTSRYGEHCTRLSGAQGGFEENEKRPSRDVFL